MAVASAWPYAWPYATLTPFDLLQGLPLLATHGFTSSPILHTHRVPFAWCSQGWAPYHCDPRSVGVVQTFPSNRPRKEYPKLFKNFWGSPKKLQGVKVRKFQYSNRLCSGVISHSHFKFLQVVGGHDVELMYPTGAPPRKKIWGRNFFHP